MIYKTREENFESELKKSIDYILSKNPDKKQRLLEENVKYSAEWGNMWALYGAIKIDRRERASDIDRKMLEDMNLRVTDYLKNKFDSPNA